MPLSYTPIPPGIVGKQKTITFRFRDRKGSLLSLTGKTLTTSVKDPAGNVITPTLTADSNQAEDGNRGIATAVITAAQTTTGGEGYWLAQGFVGESSGADEYTVGVKWWSEAALA